jgi:hypothetical protein
VNSALELAPHDRQVREVAPRRWRPTPSSMSPCSMPRSLEEHSRSATTPPDTHRRCSHSCSACE